MASLNVTISVVEVRASIENINQGSLVLNLEASIRPEHLSVAGDIFTSRPTWIAGRNASTAHGFALRTNFTDWIQKAIDRSLPGQLETRLV